MTICGKGRKMNFIFSPIRLFLHPNQHGPVAEWLGRALQKLLQRFESARDLQLTPPKRGVIFYDKIYTTHWYLIYVAHDRLLPIALGVYTWKGYCCIWIHCRGNEFWEAWTYEFVCWSMYVDFFSVTKNLGKKNQCFFCSI